MQYHIYGKNKTYLNGFISVWKMVILALSALASHFPMSGFFAAAALGLGYTLKKALKLLATPTIKRSIRTCIAALAAYGGMYTGLLLSHTLIGAMIGSVFPVIGTLITAVVFGCIGAFGGTVLGKQTLRGITALYTLCTTTPEETSLIVSRTNPTKYRLRFPDKKPANNVAIYEMLKNLRHDKKKANFSITSCIPGMQTRYKDILNDVIHDITSAYKPMEIVKKIESAEGYRLKTNRYRGVTFKSHPNGDATGYFTADVVTDKQQVIVSFSS